MKITKGELFRRLSKELNNSLPDVAKRCDVSITEAMYDKHTKDYDEFHNKECEIVELVGSL